MKRCVRFTFLFLAAASVFLQTSAIAQRRAPATDRLRPEYSVLSRNLSGFFPLEVGNEWKYSDGTDSFTVRVMREIEEANGIKYFETVGYFPDDPATARKLRRGPLGQILEYNPGGTDFLWYRFGFFEGEWSFESGENILCVTGSLVSPGDFDETVDVPAGTFKRVRHLDFVPPCADNGITGEYFASNIGLVQRVTTTFAGERIYKLVSARVGSLELPAAKYGIEVSMDRPVYFNNRMPMVANGLPTAQVLLVVRNHTEIPVEFTFSSSQRFDFIVRDAAGNEVLRWSDGLVFLQILGRVILLNESWRFPAEITLKSREGDFLPAGFYALSGYLTSQGSSTAPRMLGVVAFEIQDVY